MKNNHSACTSSNKRQLSVKPQHNHVTKHWPGFHWVNPPNPRSLNLVTLTLNPLVSQYINSARLGGPSTAEARVCWRGSETNFNITENNVTRYTHKTFSIKFENLVLVASHSLYMVTLQA
jgi:hypothetical protein